MTLRICGVGIVAFGILLAGIPGLGEGLSSLEISTDKSFYFVGETAKVTIKTHSGDPSNVYMILTTPLGQRLYADANLQFKRRKIAVVTDSALAEGQVTFPLSLATSDLAKPGEYRVEVRVSPAGQGEEDAVPAAEALFIVSLPGLNFLAIHNRDSAQYDDDCASCHVDKTQSVSLAPGILSFHSLKYRLFGGDRVPRKCLYCHSGADLINHSAGALRKQVSNDFCNRCHNGSGPAKKFYANRYARP